MYERDSAWHVRATVHPSASRGRFRPQKNSHRIYRHPDGRRVVVSYHHLSDTFPIGTLHAMIADAGWDQDDLRLLGLI